MQRAMDRFFLRSGAYRAPSTVFRTPGAAPTILKLLWLRPCLVQFLWTDSATAQQNLNQRANPAESDLKNPLPKFKPKAEAAHDVLFKNLIPLQTKI